MLHRLKLSIKRILGQRIIGRIIGQIRGKKDLLELNFEDQKLINSIRKNKLTYLTIRKLVNLAKSCHLIEEKGLPGVFLEAGCALGGSSILIASLKAKERPLFVYDVFGMIPPPTKEDTKEVHERYRTIAEGKSQGLDGDKYYGYEENLYEVVQSNLKEFGVSCEEQNVLLVQGLVGLVGLVGRSRYRGEKAGLVAE